MGHYIRLLDSVRAYGVVGLQNFHELLHEISHARFVNDRTVMTGNIVDFQITQCQAAPAVRRVRMDAIRLLRGTEQDHLPGVWPGHVGAVSPGAGLLHIAYALRQQDAFDTTFQFPVFLAELRLLMPDEPAELYPDIFDSLLRRAGQEVGPV